MSYLYVLGPNFLPSLKFALLLEILLISVAVYANCRIILNSVEITNAAVNGEHIGRFDAQNSKCAVYRQSTGKIAYTTER
jgi:hypothetical protein